ncbi:substrate-binding domain-containing protein [Microlunatus sp. GCM10028923]|uniref:substrate-binding domain-containing protein n=1 Tax=Microlunatus sp. GCM10028923 TaxID=3273400 RepID=UPI003624472C
MAVLAAERRSRILGLARKTGSVRVTDIAETLQVSEATVRRDLDSLAADGVLDKVYGGATLSQERAAAAGRVIQVGVFIPPLTAYYPRIVDGIRDLADQPDSGLALNLALPQTSPDETVADIIAAEREAISGLLDAGVDGLLLLPALEHRTRPSDEARDYAGWLRRLEVPTMLMDRELPELTLGSPSTIRMAHERGAAAAVHYLYELGHRRIALMARTDTQTAELIQAGWRQAVDDLDLDQELPFIPGKDSLTWPGWTGDRLDDVLALLRRRKITALLCHNDEDALTLVRHARSRGVAIPDQLSVIAYEDELAALAQPALTAIQPPRRELGLYAIRTLLDQIRGTAPAATQRITLDPALIIRASTAPR